MVAVGNIAMLKPNSSSIPIDKDDDTPVYLDEKFRFFIDINNINGRKDTLIYTVQPLTLYTESKLISELGYALNIQLTAADGTTDYDSIKDVVRRKRIQGQITDNHINRLIVKYSKCINPSVLLVSLKNIFSAFTVKDLTKSDYYSLYEELVAAHLIVEPDGFLRRILFKRDTIRRLRQMTITEILRKTDDIMDAYTLGMLSNQDVYTRLKVLTNIIRYEREFKKKLLLLFSKEGTDSHRSQRRRDLDKLTLLYETNADTERTGLEIPVF